MRRLLAADFKQAFSRVHALLVPATSQSAPMLSEVRRRTLAQRRRDDFFTQSANLCGLPAIAVPFGRCASHGRPLGMQLITDFLQDRLCLRLGAALERLADP